MVDKRLNTKIVLRNDTLEAFNNSDYVLAKGEMALAQIDVAQNNGQVVPTYLIKVGDGTSKFSALKYAAAQAADVYAWAKQASLPIEKTGTGNVVSNITWDSTSNKIVFTTASVATAEGLQDIQDRVAAIENGYATDEELASAKSELETAITKKLDSETFEAFKTTNTTAITAAKKAGDDAQSALDAYKLSNDAEVAKKANQSAVDDLVIVDDVKYDSASKTIQLMKGDTKVGDGFDASAFIKDGMLEDVSYDADTNTLTFTWNTDADSKTDTVVLSDIIDPYTAGDGIAITGTSIALSAATKASLGKADTAVQPATLNSYVTNTVHNADIVELSTNIAQVRNSMQEAPDDPSTLVAIRAYADQNGAIIDESYKLIQTPVTNPTVTTESATDIFVSVLSQDAQGVISMKKSKVSVGGDNFKALNTYSGADAEIWVLDGGTATTNI